MNNLKKMSLVKLDKETQKKVDGGFIVLTILGVTYSAELVAGVICGAAAAGVAAGVAAAVASDE